MPAEIRAATLNDLHVLDVLINSAFRGESSKKGWTTEADLLGGIRTNERLLKNLIEEANSEIWTYELDGQAMGCIHLKYHPEFAYLGLFTVSPFHQGMGIGKKLMKFSEQRARELNLARIQITVLAPRTDLMAWYERHGYVKTGEIRPFPMDNPDFGLPKVFLELVVLEKMIYTH